MNRIRGARTRPSDSQTMTDVAGGGQRARSSTEGVEDADTSHLSGLLIGYGSIGRRHLANLHAAGVTNWAIVHTGSGTVPLEPPCPARTYPTLEDALESESPTFAVIANPTSMHVSTALACVQ